MNPTTVRWQGVVLLAFLLLVVLFGSRAARWEALGISVLAASEFLVLNVQYAWRIHGNLRSPTRCEGDTIVGRSATAFNLLSLAATSWAVANPHFIDKGGVRDLPDVITLTVVAASASIYLSSLVDWYFVLPRRNGLFGPPLCHADTSEKQRKLFTRIWLIHRVVATLVFAVALIAVIVGGLTALQDWLPRTNYNALFISTAAVPVTIAAIPLLPWVRGMLAMMPSIGSNFRAHVGDLVGIRRDGQKMVAMVFDVSLDQGYKVVPEDHTEGAFPVLFGSPDVTHPPPAAQAIRCSAGTCRAWDVGAVCEWGTERIERGQTTALPRTAGTEPTPRWLVL